MSKCPYIIVLGNEKGGTGKSTLSMHLIVTLLKEGYNVGSIDVDARQGTLSRYIENRKIRKNKEHENLLVPDHHAIYKSTLNQVDQAESEEIERLKTAFEALKSMDYIVIDTPGSDSFLSRLTHSYADTLITPLNDSFIDLDMLVRLDEASLSILKPSTYSEMVWDQRKQRAMRGERRSMDWIVLRNRLSSINSKNKEEMQKILSALSKRIGYRLGTGFGERVIFRELFLLGLTLLDLKEAKMVLSLSHVAARQELMALLEALQIPTLRPGGIEA